MAEKFDEIDEVNDGAFIDIRFQDIIPDDHPARYIKKFIQGIDLSSFEAKYKVGKGQPGRPPKGIRMMLGVILYGIYSRIYSAHSIDRATHTYADFWLFTHRKRISHDKISKFIILHEEEMQTVFLETIMMAEKNRLLNFEAIFQDGFLLKANASKEKCHTIPALKRRKNKYKKILKEILNSMKSEESKTGLQDLQKKKKRVKKELKEIERLQEELNEKIHKRSHKDTPGELAERLEKMTINRTDPDAELSRNKQKGYDVMYTKVTAVDSEAGIVVASTISGHNDEPHTMFPLMKKANSNCNSGSYTTCVADAGFNSMGACVQFAAHNWNLIAPTRQHENLVHNKDKKTISFNYDEHNNCVRCSEGKVLDKYEKYHDSKHGSKFLVFRNEDACANCSKLKSCTKSKNGYRTVRIDVRTAVQQKVLERYKSKEGKELYKKRGHNGETFQGDLKKNGRFIQFYRKGLEKVIVDSTLHDTVWNLRRMFNVKGRNMVWNQ